MPGCIAASLLAMEAPNAAVPLTVAERDVEEASLWAVLACFDPSFAQQPKPSRMARATSGFVPMAWAAERIAIGTKAPNRTCSMAAAPVSSLTKRATFMMPFINSLSLLLSNLRWYPGTFVKY